MPRPAHVDLPAFAHSSDGLTRREYFAVHLMAGHGEWLPNFKTPEGVTIYSPEWVALANKARAEYAVAAADALMEALSK